MSDSRVSKQSNAPKSASLAQLARLGLPWPALLSGPIEEESNERSVSECYMEGYEPVCLKVDIEKFLTEEAIWGLQLDVALQGVQSRRR
jgi:hypothetical protein